MTQFVESGGARLAVERLGAGRPAIALHAGVCDRRSWRSLAAELDGRLGVVGYDRRGFGETEYVTEPHRHVDDLRAVLDAVVPGQPAWLIGNSQGGRIAIDFALAAPDRVAGLVLIGTAVSAADDAPDPEETEAETRLDDAIVAADEAGDLAEVNRLEAHLWLDGPSSPEGRVGGVARELFLAMNGRALEAEDPGDELPPPGLPALGRLEDLAVPCLVLCGDLDVQGVRQRSWEIAERVPDARGLVLEGLAHVPQLERPADVAATIAGFVS